jgi:hypothetical protein
MTRSLRRGIAVSTVAAAMVGTFTVAAQANPIITVSSDASALAAALGVTGVNTAILAGDSQAGTFTDADATPVFFSSGLFLTSGVGSCIPGPNSSGSCTGGGSSSTLTINFTPSADATTIGFKFIFGSEEFPEFVDTAFQDSFQFLVNGVNFAKLTNGNLVTIDNLWQSDDYVPNHADFTRLGITHGTSTIDHRTQLDGFSTILQFVAPVNAGAPNTLVLTIMDVGDSAFDSAVMIQGGSFEENPDPDPIPEPASVMLFGLGAMAAATRMRKRIA